MSPVDASVTRQRAVPAPSPDPAPIRLPWVRLDNGVPAPAYAHPGDAGADLVTMVDVVLAPGQRTVVGTGVAVALPPGFAGFVHARSGLAARHGLGVVNAPGVIDAGYRGEIKVCLINHDGEESIALRRGDRIAQLVVQRVERVEFELVDELTPTVRGERGYGSTGVAGASVSTRTVETAEPAVRDGKD